MPQLVIQTNLRLHQIPVDFHRKAAELIATLQNKPATMTMVVVQPNQLIRFGGGQDDYGEPCALVQLQSIGSVSADENRLAAKRLTELLESELSISPRRTFVNFVDMRPENVAWNGMIYEDIFAKTNDDQNGDADEAGKASAPPAKEEEETIPEASEPAEPESGGDPEQPEMATDDEPAAELAAEGE